MIETVLLLACIAGISFFFHIRRCPFDIPALIVWGAVLLVVVPLLVRGEIRLRREEERQPLDRNQDNTGRQQNKTQ